MAEITISNASKGFGDVAVLRDLSLQVRDGEFLVVVGPSGCGKSTLLRSICGLESIDAGRIEIGGRDVTRISPSHRGAAMVFQSYALYPHMTVAENMGFALRMERAPKAEIASRVQRAASILKLEALLQRKPKELSGGQRQRVAIGRAIVRNPQVFLFDEPLSNLDAELRVQMRLELATLHRELGTTMIYVTHDQVEAMTMADRIVVMRSGVIEQVGRPTELYDRPANRFVAGFIGSPRMNFLAARLGPVVSGRALITLTDQGAQSVTIAADRLPADADTACTLGIRPEHVRVIPAPIGSTRILHIENLGPHLLVYLRNEISGETLVAQHQGEGVLSIGDTVDISFNADKAMLFP